MPKKNSKIVLGIDPGFERLGVAIIETENTPQILFSDCLRTSSKNLFSFRLFYLMEKIEEIIHKFKPDILALETLFINKNQKTAMLVSEVRGAIKYIAQKNSLALSEMTPLEIKMSVTGFGRADKTAVFKMISKIFKMPPKKLLDDEIDAIAIALAVGLKQK